jgi:hypothetical protein
MNYTPGVVEMRIGFSLSPLEEIVDLDVSILLLELLVSGLFAGSDVCFLNLRFSFNCDCDIRYYLNFVFIK